MIVYLATYPRSGNSLVQQVISRNFRILPLNAKATAKHPNGPPAFAKWDVQMDRPPLASFSRLGQRYSFIPPQVGNVMPNDVRAAAASSPDVMFVKTHAAPLDAYLPGERVLQVARHPGAVILSYFRYLTGLGQAVTLDQVIEGDVPFGDWSDYVDIWSDAAAYLSNRHLTLPYERVAHEAGYAPSRIAAFTGLAPLNLDPPDFAAYAAGRPDAGLRGQTAGYEAHYTREQLVRLWDRHGAVAARYGFTAPDLTQAA